MKNILFIVLIIIGVISCKKEEDPVVQPRPKKWKLSISLSGDYHPSKTPKTCGFNGKIIINGAPIIFRSDSMPAGPEEYSYSYKYVVWLSADDSVHVTAKSDKETYRIWNSVVMAPISDSTDWKGIEQYYPQGYFKTNAFQSDNIICGFTTP